MMILAGMLLGIAVACVVANSFADSLTARRGRYTVKATNNIAAVSRFGVVR